jgi:hypothetical protein
MTDRQSRSRRRFLKHTGVFLVTGLATSGSDNLISPDPHAIAAELIRLLHLREQARRVGRVYLRANRPGEPDSVEPLTRKLMASLGFDVDHLGLIPADALREAVMKKVHKDYDEEHTAIVDDWLLSRTEARLCAILYLEARDHPYLV